MVGVDPLLRVVLHFSRAPWVGSTEGLHQSTLEEDSPQNVSTVQWGVLFTTGRSRVFLSM